jgi:hypothetical protein
VKLWQRFACRPTVLPDIAQRVNSAPKYASPSPFNRFLTRITLFCVYSSSVAYLETSQRGSGEKHFTTFFYSISVLSVSPVGVRPNGQAVAHPKLSHRPATPATHNNKNFFRSEGGRSPERPPPLNTPLQFIKDNMPSIGTYKRSNSPAFDGSSRSSIDVADGYATDLRKLRWAANDNIN